MPADTVTAKDPRRVAAGRTGMLKRWGPPGTRRVHLGDLTPDQRRLVIALVEALRGGSVADDAT